VRRFTGKLLKCDLKQKVYLQQKYFGLEIVMTEQEADALVKFTEIMLW
jgi:hypothetical protein